MSILLTGLPRAGTTWASRAIAAATGSRVAHEPFNWRRRPDRLPYHMKYLPSGSNDPSLIDILERASRPRHTFPWSARPVVVKDVHICLALEIIWEELHPRVIILVRHPCALAHSWARLGYEVRFRLDLLLSQEKLMADHLNRFEAHLRQRGGFFFEVGAYWGAAYFVLARQSARHSEWQWATHESLCVDSFSRYQALLQRAGVELSRGGQAALRRFLEGHNRRRRGQEGPYSVSRLSAAEPDKWLQRLDPDQIRAVLSGAAPFGVLETWYDRPEDRSDGAFR